MNEQFGFLSAKALLSSRCAVYATLLYGIFISPNTPESSNTEVSKEAIANSENILNCTPVYDIVIMSKYMSDKKRSDKRPFMAYADQTRSN